MAVGNITNIISAKDLPSMSEEELLANVTFVTVDGSGKMKQINRPALFNTIGSVVQKGDKGDKGDTGAVGATGATGLKGDKGDKGDTGLTGATGATGARGLQGFDGWTPIISIVANGSNQVLQVINWTNPNPSATNKPSFPVYVSSTGFTTDINAAVNIKGSQGVQGIDGISGADGWSPAITLKDYNGLLYFYINSWVGGTGSPPTTVGYISPVGITQYPMVGTDIGSLPTTLPFNNITSRPTTLDGYGITDAVPRILIGELDGVSPLTETVVSVSDPNLIYYSDGKVRSIQILNLTANGILSCDLASGQSVTVFVPATTFTLDLSGFTIGNNFTAISSTKPTTLLISNFNGTKVLYGTIGV